MENKENTPRKSPISSQYARRVLQEINAPRAQTEISKTQAENLPAGAVNQETPKANQSTSNEPEPSEAQSIFPDIRPEAFSRERRTLRNLAGRIYLIYCHLCCLDKKFRLSESDMSYNTDNEVEQIVVKDEKYFYFGKTPEIELEKMVLITARYNFGGTKNTSESSASFISL